MDAGHKSDLWLNLFGYQHKNKKVAGSIKAKTDLSVDDLFIQVETLLKAQHKKGGLTASAKSSIDRYLDKMVNKAEPNVEKQEKSPTKTEH